MDAAYGFTKGMDYGSIVATSERVAWTVDEVFSDRRFDPSRPLVPPSWVGTASLGFLNEQQQLTLNHCRAFSYAHLLGNYEEFIPVHVMEVVEQDWHADRNHLRALLRFGEEEMKHQQLFRRVETLLEEACGHPFGRYFGDDKARVTELTHAILLYPRFARFLILMALEWGTQRHYVESVQGRAAETSDSLYVDVLKAHWVEESQHARSDALEVARVAREMDPDELEAAFDEVAGIGRLIDATFAGQVTKEIETLEDVTHARLVARERTLLHDALYRSMSTIIAGVALTHPSFTRAARELSVRGAARLGIR